MSSLKVKLIKDDGNSFTKEAGAPLSFATLSFAPLSFAQNQRKVAEGSENAPKGKRKCALSHFSCPLKAARKTAEEARIG